jgi:hypothetical protein
MRDQIDNLCGPSFRAKETRPVQRMKPSVPNPRRVPDVVEPGGDDESVPVLLRQLAAQLDSAAGDGADVVPAAPQRLDKGPGKTLGGINAERVDRDSRRASGCHGNRR